MSVRSWRNNFMQWQSENKKICTKRTFLFRVPFEVCLTEFNAYGIELSKRNCHEEDGTNNRFYSIRLTKTFIYESHLAIYSGIKAQKTLLIICWRSSLCLESFGIGERDRLNTLIVITLMFFECERVGLHPLHDLWSISQR